MLSIKQTEFIKLQNFTIQNINSINFTVLTIESSLVDNPFELANVSDIVIADSIITFSELFVF